MEALVPILRDGFVDSDESKRGGGDLQGVTGTYFLESAAHASQSYSTHVDVFHDYRYWSVLFGAEVDMARRKTSPSKNKNTKKQIIVPSRFTRISALLIRVVNWDELEHEAFFQPTWLSCLEAP